MAAAPFSVYPSAILRPEGPWIAQGLVHFRIVAVVLRAVLQVKVAGLLSPLCSFALTPPPFSATSCRSHYVCDRTYGYVICVLT